MRCLLQYLVLIWTFIKRILGLTEKIKIVCISDTHGNNIYNMNIPDGDILIHTGDMTKFGSYKEICDFNYQISKLPHKYKIVVAGNHDIILDDDYYFENLLMLTKTFNRHAREPKRMLNNCIYLHDESIELFGYKFYGSPYQPSFRNMGFNRKRCSIELQEKWNQIPKDTDILLTHTPPYKYGDLTERDGKNVGCELLMLKVEEIKPKYHIFGHIHEGYGEYTNGHTHFINCSSCNLENEIDVNKPPVIFTLDLLQL